MAQKIVYQTDRNGWYLGETLADECEFEPGTYHIPAGCVEEKPPLSNDEAALARWDGREWSLQVRPKPEAESAQDKLLAFLQQNPEVMALLNKDAK